MNQPALAEPEPAFDPRDPAWLAHRYDRPADAIRYRYLPRARHAAMPFLIDEHLGPGEEIALPRSQAVAAARAASGERRIGFLFHSAFCASTLLVRAFDRPGMAMGLSEPVILNDLVGMRRRGELDGARLGERMDDALALLERPWGAGEAVIVKPSNILNPLAAGLLTLRPAANAILLRAPLPVFLTSVAKKGLWCRRWVRELYEGLAQDRVAELGVASEELFRLSDLQVAALGWLAQQRLFAALVDRFGPNRVRTVTSDLLLAQPGRVALAAARHWGIALDPAAAEAIASGPAFTRHSKSGERFDAQDRAVEYRAAEQAHRDEIEMVAAWAAAVAKANAIALDAPAPLLAS